MFPGQIFKLVESSQTGTSATFIGKSFSILLHVCVRRGVWITAAKVGGITSTNIINATGRRSQSDPSFLAKISSTMIGMFDFQILGR